MRWQWALRLAVNAAFGGAFLLIGTCPGAAAAPAGNIGLRSNDVVAFVGGTEVASTRDGSHLETLLALSVPGARFRNLGWEGDTVFAQPREVGYPRLGQQLKRIEASVVVIEFGRSEALTGAAKLSEFRQAYDQFLETCAAQTARLVLVVPAPFETGGAFLPDLTSHNADLARFAEAIRDLAHQRGLPVIDLFSAFDGANHRARALTTDGLQFSPRGFAMLAVAAARQLGFAELAERAGRVDEQGRWRDRELESLRQVVVAKNALWFNYSRPQNWAFLGGDRTDQPSSRDHRDRRIRWFPTEMEKYVPMIEAREKEIETRARAAQGGKR